MIQRLPRYSRMESTLIGSGHDEDYLDSLSNSELEDLYNEEILGIDPLDDEEY